MQDDLEKYAVAVIIVFGALIIGGLMAATIASGNRDGFLLALGSATLAWIAGHAMMLDMPRFYVVLIGLAALMAMGSTVTLL
ncbi:hypothetical protein [Mesorhizobium xinjiangense]|uniref:hypothetical protein n=1 Tax=Mesorhizobium xinjiangense TaxID=2678685 RepID=UPI0012EE8216|nr:hypothetical protein [Mesorhizobium xinjiangense]